MGKGKLKPVPMLDDHESTTNGGATGNRFDFARKNKCPSGSLCAKMTFLAVLVGFILTSNLYFLEYKEGQLTKVADITLEMIRDFAKEVKEVGRVVFQEGNKVVEKFTPAQEASDQVEKILPQRGDDSKTNGKSASIEEKNSITENEKEDEDNYIELLKVNMDAKIDNPALHSTLKPSENEDFLFTTKTTQLANSLSKHSTTQLVNDQVNKTVHTKTSDTVKVTSKLADDSAKASEMKVETLKLPKSVESSTSELPMKSTTELSMKFTSIKPVFYNPKSKSRDNTANGKQASVEEMESSSTRINNPTESTKHLNDMTKPKSIKPEVSVNNYPTESDKPNFHEKVQNTLDKAIPSPVISPEVTTHSTPLETTTSIKAEVAEELRPLKSKVDVIFDNPTTVEPPKSMEVTKEEDTAERMDTVEKSARLPGKSSTMKPIKPSNTKPETSTRKQPVTTSPMMNETKVSFETRMEGSP